MGWENKESSGTILDFGELIKSQKLHMRKTDSQDECLLDFGHCIAYTVICYPYPVNEKRTLWKPEPPNHCSGLTVPA